MSTTAQTDTVTWYSATETDFGFGYWLQYYDDELSIDAMDGYELQAWYAE